MSTVIRFKCPQCGKALNVSADKAGRKVACKCGQHIRVPEAGELPSDPSKTFTLTPPQSSQPLDLPLPAELPTHRQVEVDPVTVPLKATLPPPAAKAEPIPRAAPRPAPLPPKLRPCPACSQPVSKTVFRCPHCGHSIRKPRRGLIGFLFKWAFILFNVLMAYALYAGSTAGGRIVAEAKSDAQAAGAIIGTGLGVGVLLFVWLVGDVILGLIVLLTRPKVY